MRSSQGDLWGATAAALEIHLGLSTWLRFDQSRMDLGGVVAYFAWSLPVVHHGRGREVFRFSRNPVFLGMATIFAGALLIAPNAIMIASFSLAIFAMSIQIRREVAFLSKKIGPAYETFRASGGGSRERILRREHDQQLVRYGDRFAAWRGA